MDEESSAEDEESSASFLTYPCTVSNIWQTLITSAR